METSEHSFPRGSAAQLGPKPIQDTNLHVLSGIQTHDPVNQAAADLRLRRHGHRYLLALSCHAHDFPLAQMALKSQKNRAPLHARVP
jgi:hypothetical protein